MHFHVHIFGGRPLGAMLKRAEPDEGGAERAASGDRHSWTMTPAVLSTKPIPPDERLILALDLPSAEAAWRLVERLGERVRFYKLGLELFMAGGYFELIEALRERDKRVFVDLKFFDVPQTVASAVRQLAKHGADFATVHGNDAILEAACAAKEDLRILAVTVLTSLDQGDMEALGFQTDIPALVLSRARRALALGCDGVISSGLEARALRRELGERLMIVVPGIRPGAQPAGRRPEADDGRRGGFPRRRRPHRRRPPDPRRRRSLRRRRRHPEPHRPAVRRLSGCRSARREARKPEGRRSGWVVTTATGSTGRRSTSSSRKRCTRLASTIVASAIASGAPMQTRGPTPKGR